MPIRLANRKDLPALVDIYNQAIRAGHQTAHLDPVSVESRQQWFDAHMGDDQLLLVSLQDDIIMGYLTLSSYRPGRRALQQTQEVSIYIHQDFQGRGIGSALLEHAIRLCPSRNIRSLIAIILASNKPSISFFKQQQFQEWGHLPEVAEINGTRVGQIYLGRNLQKP